MMIVMRLRLRKRTLMRMRIRSLTLIMLHLKVMKNILRFRSVMLWRMRVDTLGEKEMNYAERAETVNDNDVEDEGMVDGS